MKILKKNYTLNKRIYLCFIVTLILLLIMLIYQVLAAGKESRDQIYEQLSRDKAYVADLVDKTLTSIETTAKDIGYSSAVQKVVFSSNAEDKITNMTMSRELISNSKDKNDYIVDFFYYSESGHIYSHSNFLSRYHESVSSLGLDDGKEIKKSFITNEVISEGSTNFIFKYIPIHNTIKAPSHSNSGYCALLFNLKKLLPQNITTIDSDSSAYVIYNDRIMSCYEPDEAFDEHTLSLLNSNTAEIEYNDKLYLCSVQINGSWKTVCLQEKKKLDFAAAFDTRFFIILFFGSILLIILLSRTSRGFSDSVNSMVNELTEISSTGISNESSEKRRISSTNIEELQIISDEINNLLDRIEASSENEVKIRQQLYEASLTQQQAELIAYRSQINPHFFFNTLECIRSMAAYYNAEMIEELVTAMSKLFRYSLYSKRVVTFSDEMDMLEQYFIIMSFRFPDEYLLERNIDESVNKFPVPSMILQPLVENSIKHAFNRKRRGIKNTITITASFAENENVLILKIRDNGCGMTEEELKILDANKSMPEDKSALVKSSIGIKNIFKRIKLFNENNQLNFRSEYGNYLEVELILHPANPDINEHIELLLKK